MAYSQLLLFQRILWATETALFWQNLCMYPLIYPSVDIIDLPSEEASVSYPECILWATVSCDLLCIKVINVNIITTYLFHRVIYCGYYSRTASNPRNTVVRFWLYIRLP